MLPFHGELKMYVITGIEISAHDCRTIEMFALLSVCFVGLLVYFFQKRGNISRKNVEEHRCEPAAVLVLSHIQPLAWR